MRTNYLLFFAVLLGAFPAAGAHAAADSLSTGVVLYSPYTKIVVSPGASINYSVDLINNGHEIRTENIALGGLPSSWKYDIKSGGWNIEQMAVLPDEKKNFTLTVNVPLKINKGSYKFHLSAGEARLPLTIVVSKQGTYQSEFTTDQPNMQGNSKSNFTFSTTLRNQTADRQLYALMADAPRGWNVVFKPNYKQATSAQVDANASQNISVEVTPAANAEAGTYKIPVRAVTNSTSAELTLEIAITGTFQMEVTTPKGLLSADITAGDTPPYRSGGRQYRIVGAEGHPALLAQTRRVGTLVRAVEDRVAEGRGCGQRHGRAQGFAESPPGRLRGRDGCQDPRGDCRCAVPDFGEDAPVLGMGRRACHPGCRGRGLLSFPQIRKEVGHG